MLSDTSSLTYPFCGFSTETESHLFVTCELALSGLFRVFRWSEVTGSDPPGAYAAF